MHINIHSHGAEKINLFIKVAVAAIHSINPKIIVSRYYYLKQLEMNIFMDKIMKYLVHILMLFFL